MQFGQIHLAKIKGWIEKVEKTFLALTSALETY